MNPRSWPPALLPVLIAAAMGAGYIFLSPLGNMPFTADDGVYWEMGQNILRGAGLVYDGFYSLRPPGYPLFLAAAAFVTGSSPLLVRLLQVPLLALTALLVYRAGRRYYDERTAFAAALVLALSYDAFIMPSAILSEALFAPAIAAWLCLAPRGGEQRVRPYALEGTALGLVYLIRQEAAIILLFVLACRAFYEGRAALARAVLTPLACFLLIVSVWGARNWSIHGKFFVGTTYSQRHLLAANWAVFQRMGYDFSSFGLVYEELDHVQGIRDELKKEEKRKEWVGRMFGTVGLKALPKAVAIKFGSFFYPFLPWYDFTYMLTLPFLLAGFAAGLRRFRELYPLYAVAAMSLAVITLFHGVPRYRSSIIQTTSLFAACGLLLVLKQERPLVRAFPFAWAFLNALVLFYAEPLRLAAKKLL